MDHALLGRAVDLRLKFGKKLHGFIRFAGLGQGADFLFRSAHGADLDTIKGATTKRAAGLLCGRTSISHSPPNCRKPATMSTRLSRFIPRPSFSRWNRRNRPR